MFKICAVFASTLLPCRTRLKQNMTFFFLSCSGNQDVEEDVCDKYKVAKYVRQRDDIDKRIQEAHQQGLAVKAQIEAENAEISMKRVQLNEEITMAKEKLKELQVLHFPNCVCLYLCLYPCLCLCLCLFYTHAHAYAHVHAHVYAPVCVRVHAHTHARTI